MVYHDAQGGETVCYARNQAGRSHCVQGDVAALQFGEGFRDFVGEVVADAFESRDALVVV